MASKKGRENYGFYVASALRASQNLTNGRLRAAFLQAEGSHKRPLALALFASFRPASGQAARVEAGLLLARIRQNTSLKAR
jgi:hypothetical protein